ncbi:TauD/TfdA family dioxygenase [Hydrogenophaga sp.]|uniref:TauD/TfdA dioxygenase family protein n=1 Tax=Hydrogenophaga sp. TaxID=1904254 RepID=UPI00272572A8|nr:TauD/TfdA family dioxygenase [Hydrogenophaga sp.]MDO9437015.1 TauD/TfdA family dioxygenase [Hydrogenophaga sp.]
MPITIHPLAPHLGAEIRGLDLAQPLSDQDFETVRQAFYDHGLIVVRDHPFGDDDHIRFSQRFGELKRLKFDAYLGERRPEIFVVSNIKKDDQYIGAHDAGMFWHSDGPFLDQPHGPSALHALEVPEQDGRALGNTEFTNTAAAYDALSPEMKRRIEGMQAVNSLARRFELAQREGVQGTSAARQASGEVLAAVHPVARVHPVTGRKCLYVSDGYTTEIVGMPQDEAKALIKELTDHVVKPDFRYTHAWRVHDLVMWDNCATQHKATFDYKLPQRRLMHRTTLEG